MAEILNAQFDEWKIDFQIPVDGDYTVETRDASKMVVYGLGIKPVATKHGVTQALRKKVHEQSLTPTEKEASRKRLGWRQFQRRKYADGGLCRPVSKISTHANGFEGPAQEQHDGVDLICPENAPIFAICTAKVIDVRAEGWFPGPQLAGHALSEGDGIIQLEGLAISVPSTRGCTLAMGTPSATQWKSATPWRRAHRSAMQGSPTPGTSTSWSTTAPRWREEATVIRGRSSSTRSNTAMLRRMTERVLHRGIRPVRNGHLVAEAPPP